MGSMGRLGKHYGKYGKHYGKFRFVYDNKKGESL